MNDPVIFIVGAGKIGRSFIGQLFGRNGYRVVFADVDKELVEELNRRGSYPVIIKAPESEEKMVIRNVRAIHAEETGTVAGAIAEADILAVCVGKQALKAVVPVVANGLRMREERSPGRVLDIILAENMRSAGPWFRQQLAGWMPPGYPVGERVGLVETSIGKMVPIMTAKELEEDPLQVFAEPYNTLILDRKGFRGEIPPIAELALKENMIAWVDRKAFIHNLGHASAAYRGFLRSPEAVFMWEVLEDKGVKDFARDVMREAAGVLVAEYPGEFTMEQLDRHIEDLLARFMNRSLGDTLFRVGSDLRRKLGKDDRFTGIIRMARNHGKPFGTILEAMAMGFHFTGRDEAGRMHPGDREFRTLWNRDPDRVLLEICGLDPAEDDELIRVLKAYRNRPKSW